ncbi:MAG: glycosyltransferase [Bacteroidales bacterium]|nr:glycosyltransferase [Bacteroidales bacterium]
MLAEYFSQNPILFSVLAVLAFSTLVQLIYFWGIFSRVAFFRHRNITPEKEEAVSVIVCARNEFYNLSENLPYLLNQDYGKYEVVVVDHGSDDDTNYLLRDLQGEYPHLKVVSMPQDLNFFTGKKFPLSIGIKSASYDAMLLTDADCIPRSNQWLRQMASEFIKGTEIVLGYGAYERQKGLLNLLIRFDTMRVALQYFGFALSGMPYMGVGRNIAYRKSLFFRQGGFISHYRIQTGDDDLFVNRAASKKNTRVEFRSESHTLSAPKKTFSLWFRQKRRHLQSGNHYRFSHKFALALFGLTQVLFYASFIVLLSFWYLPYIVLGIIGLRLATQLFIFGKAMRKLSEKGFLLLVPFFEVFMLILNPIIAVANLFNKPVKWR